MNIVNGRADERVDERDKAYQQLLDRQDEMEGFYR